MNNSPALRRVLAGAAVSLATLGLTACVVAPLPGYYGGEVVGVAPPPPQVEYYGAPPLGGQIWLNGYWGWNGGRHHWVPGQWSAPRPGHRWHPHRWDRAQGGWRERPGHWERRR